MSLYQRVKKYEKFNLFQRLSKITNILIKYITWIKINAIKFDFFIKLQKIKLISFICSCRS